MPRMPNEHLFLTVTPAPPAVWWLGRCKKQNSLSAGAFVLYVSRCQRMSSKHGDSQQQFDCCSQQPCRPSKAARSFNCNLTSFAYAHVLHNEQTEGDGGFQRKNPPLRSIIVLLHHKVVLILQKRKRWVDAAVSGSS